MSRMLEELVSGSPAEAAEKLAALASVSRGLRKQAVDWSELGGQALGGLKSFGNSALRELKSGNPLYTGAAGALAGAGAGLAGEIMNPEDNDYTNVLTGAGIGGAIGATGGLAYKALGESLPGGKDPAHANSLSQNVGSGINQAFGSAAGALTGTTPAPLPATRADSGVKPGSNDWYNIPRQVSANAPGTTTGALSGAVLYGLRHARAQNAGATVGQLQNAINAAGNPQIVGQSTTGLLSNQAALEELARRNSGGRFPGVRTGQLNDALKNGFKVRGVPDPIAASTVQQFAKSMGGPRRVPFSKTVGLAPVALGAGWDLFQAWRRNHQAAAAAPR